MHPSTHEHVAHERSFTPALLAGLLVAILVALLPAAALAHDPEITMEYDRDSCTFTSVGNHPYFPLLPGYVLELEGEEEDDEGEMVEISARITVLAETEMVDGVETRVIEEFEQEDGELIEVSRNFMAMCRETGAVWYFGEDVDDYEDGVIVGHGGQWRAGIGDNEPGVIMPATPMVGAKFFSELAPGIALDFGEIVSLDGEVTVPLGTFDDLLKIEEGSALDPDDFSEKWYFHGIGLVKDDELELVSITAPPCMPDATTHCLSDGRFRIEAEWTDGVGGGSDANAILASADSGEFWFFGPNNTELLVKVLDACDQPANSFWVFAAGLTQVGVTLTVTDTVSSEQRVYENPVNTDFAPILDTSAFATCP